MWEDPGQPRRCPPLVWDILSSRQPMNEQLHVRKLVHWRIGIDFDVVAQELVVIPQAPVRPGMLLPWLVAT